MQDERISSSIRIFLKIDFCEVYNPIPHTRGSKLGYVIKIVIGISHGIEISSPIAKGDEVRKSDINGETVRTDPL